MSSTEEAKRPEGETKTDAPSTTGASTFVFGSGTAFGGATGGFGAFAKPAPKEGEDDGEEGGDADPEAECKAEFKPVVQLEEVETSTGEEDEAQLLNIKCKLYRWATETSEWKERGVGHVRLLEHRETQRIRLLMREEKTLKIRANHLVIPGTHLVVHQGNEKSYVWSTVDFAEEVQRPEKFAIRFGTEEKAKEFKKAFDDAAEKNAKTLGISADADKLAEELEKTKVEDKE